MTLLFDIPGRVMYKNLEFGRRIERGRLILRLPA